MPGEDPNQALRDLISRDDHEIATALLQQGADPNLTGDHGVTPLIWAVGKGDLTLTILLLARGADVHARDGFGRTAMIHAIGHASAVAVELIEVLLHYGAEVNTADQFGVTPLKEAIRSSDRDAVKLLLDRGAQFDAMALNWAAYFNRTPDICRLLVARGADPNSRVEGGDTPLMAAVSEFNPQVVRWLLRRGVDVDARNEKGQTALMLAQREPGTREHLTLQRIFRKAGVTG